MMVGKVKGAELNLQSVMSIMTSDVMCKRELMSYPNVDDVFAIGLELSISMVCAQVLIRFPLSHIIMQLYMQL